MASTSNRIDLEDGSDNFVRTVSRDYERNTQHGEVHSTNVDKASSDSSAKKSGPSNSADDKSSSTSTYILVPISFRMDGTKVKLDLKNVSGKAQLVSSSPGPLPPVPTTGACNVLAAGDHNYSTTANRRQPSTSGSSVGRGVESNARYPEPFDSVKFLQNSPVRGSNTLLSSAPVGHRLPVTSVAISSRTLQQEPASYVNLPSQIAARNDSVMTLGRQSSATKVEKLSTSSFTTFEEMMTPETVTRSVTSAVQNGFGLDFPPFGISPQELQTSWTNREPRTNVNVVASISTSGICDTNGKRSLSDDHSSPCTNSSVGSPLTQLLLPLVSGGAPGSTSESPHFPATPCSPASAGNRASSAAQRRTVGASGRKDGPAALCAYPLKQCKQHRVNGYAFCIRHILQDPTAPYKLCEFVRNLPKRNVRCTNPVPDAHGQRYCTTHLIAMGVREKKPGKKATSKQPKQPSSACSTPSTDPTDSGLKSPLSTLVDAVASGSTGSVNVPQSVGGTGGATPSQPSQIANMTAAPATPFGRVDFPMPSDFMEESGNGDDSVNDQVSTACPLSTQADRVSFLSLTPVRTVHASSTLPAKATTDQGLPAAGDYMVPCSRPPLLETEQHTDVWSAARFGPARPQPMFLNGTGTGSNLVTVSNVPKQYRSWASPTSSDRSIERIQPSHHHNSSYSSASDRSSSAACTPDSHFLSPHHHAQVPNAAGENTSHDFHTSTPGEQFYTPSPSLARRSADHVAEYLVPSISPDTLSSPGLASTSQLPSPRISHSASSSGFRPPDRAVAASALPSFPSGFPVVLPAPVSSFQQAVEHQKSSNSNGFAFPTSSSGGSDPVLQHRTTTGREGQLPCSAPVQLTSSPQLEPQFRQQLLLPPDQRNYGRYDDSSVSKTKTQMRLHCNNQPIGYPAVGGAPPERKIDEPSHELREPLQQPQVHSSLPVVPAIRHQPGNGVFAHPSAVGTSSSQLLSAAHTEGLPTHPVSKQEGPLTYQQAAEGLARAAHSQARSQVIRLSPKGFFRTKAPCRFRRYAAANPWTQLVDALDAREFGRRDLFPLGFELSESEDDTSSDEDVPLSDLVLGSDNPAKWSSLDRLTSYASLVADTRHGLRSAGGLASVLRDVWPDVPGTSNDDELKLLGRLLVDRDKPSRKQVIREETKWPVGSRSYRRCMSQTGGKHCTAHCLPWANFCQDHLPQSLDQCLLAYCTQPGCHNPTFDPLPDGPKCRLHQDYKHCLDESTELTASGGRRRKPKRYMGIGQKRRRRKPSILSTPTPPPTSSRLLSPTALNPPPLPASVLRGTPPLVASPPHSGRLGAMTMAMVPSAAGPLPPECLPGTSIGHPAAAEHRAVASGVSLGAEHHPLDFDSLAASTSRETHEAQISLDSVAQDLGFKAEELFSLPDDDLANLITDRNDKNKSEENLLDLEPPHKPTQHSWADVEQFLLSEGYRPQ